MTMVVKELRRLLRDFPVSVQSKWGSAHRRKVHRWDVVIKRTDRRPFGQELADRITDILKDPDNPEFYCGNYDSLILPYNLVRRILFPDMKIPKVTVTTLLSPDIQDMMTDGGRVILAIPRQQ